ncbi:hypothetical protein BU26DRAFT_71372 [Trematosphaeria pertusa]|uniref:Uncharacterized protein n=1 Tax=Trematosphaeria pertusa TaxID=390896 RepID=A0A6A6I4U9_9PLEO|nr:uncharacterized protein BU26DRAFT_71372 [Trematosphaeria pertusa]KAF2245565.1 hypothetical protein BU26DRAFT_71372 [Trematosphaeria pertusa]
MAPDTMIQVRDFDTDKIGFALPTSRLGGYDDIIERAYVPLFKHRRVFDAHLHLSREGCGKRVDKPRWERGEYVVGKLVVVYVHFVRRDGVDDYGFPLKKTGEEVEEEEESEEELSSDSDVDQTPTATAQTGGAVGTAIMCHPADLERLRHPPANGASMPSKSGSRPARASTLTQRLQPLPLKNDTTSKRPAQSPYSTHYSSSYGITPNPPAPNSSSARTIQIAPPPSGSNLQASEHSQRPRQSESPLFEPEGSDAEQRVTDPGLRGSESPLFDEDAWG